MTETIKQIDAFIARIIEIPEHEIGCGNIDKQCILWHLGMRDNKSYLDINDDVRMLGHIFGAKSDAQSTTFIYEINDGIFTRNEQLNSKLKFMLPKERIIYALQYFREIIVQNPDNHDDLNEYIHSMILSHTNRDY